MKISTLSFILICGFAASLSGCSQLGWQSSSDAEPTTVAKSEVQPTKPETITMPIKQGADIVIESSVAGSAAAGENGTATLSVIEPYSGGTLTLVATGSEGLNVFGAETTAQMDMSQGGPHSVRLDYSADTDGVYYINIVTTASLPDGSEDNRAHAVRVEIGDWESVVEKQKSAQVELSADGEAVVIMEAEETIE
ncbi:MAG: hypothetical protein AAGH90_07920 [Pseudomonadota bacterium]